MKPDFSLTGSPMPASDLRCNLMWALMVCGGLTEVEASAFSVRSMRRMLATFADGLQLPVEQRDYLGDWKQSDSNVPMRSRYSDTRLSSASRARRLILAAMGHLLKHKPMATHLDARLVAEHFNSYSRAIEKSIWGVRAIGDDADVPAPDADDGEYWEGKEAPIRYRVIAFVKLRPPLSHQRVCASLSLSFSLSRISQFNLLKCLTRPHLA